jgi:hypothetical protein
MIAEPTYRSLDLVKGLAKGWRPDLNRNEMQVLLYIAQHGRHNEKGFAFAWHPMRGIRAWAQEMGMAERVCYRTLGSLKAKGLLSDVCATTMWNHVGFGVTDGIMKACKCAASGRDSVPLEADKCAASGNFAPPLTRENVVHNQGVKQGTEATVYTGVGTPTLGNEEKNMTPFQTYDDFDTPQDGYDDFDVPKEAKQKRPSKKGPAYRLVDLFYEAWSKARCQNTTWGVAYNTRAVAQKFFNNLLEEHSEAEISKMIEVFFRQALAGNLRLSGLEMWRDLSNNRAEVWRIVRDSGTVSKPVTRVDNTRSWDLMIAEKARTKIAEDERAARIAAKAALKEANQ